MKKVLSFIILSVLLTGIVFTGTAMADDWFESSPGHYTILDENNKELTVMAREVTVNDEYISGDNKHYIVTKVDKKKREASTRLVGDITMPTINFSSHIETAQQDKGSVLLYCTHNSESYVPSDGEESTRGGGGINDVAQTLAKNLEKKGIQSVFQKEVHDPHDAGAYRRSRKTAVSLIKENMPVRAVFDIHRDAVPKSHYVTEVDGQDMTKVRIVIGRRNQNRKANEELAYKIKSVADKVHPGLIKDIFIGKGSYNQELSPRSLLFEMGTAENSKEAAQTSTAYLADVISRTLFGGNEKEQSNEKESDDRNTGRDNRDRNNTDRRNPRNDNNDRDNKGRRINQQTNGNNEDAGGSRGIIWLVVIVAVALGGFLLISMGGRELKSKFKGSSRQEMSSFLGRKDKKK